MKKFYNLWPGFNACSIQTLFRASNALMAEVCLFLSLVGSILWPIASTRRGSRQIRCIGNKRKDIIGRPWHSESLSKRFKASKKSCFFLKKKGNKIFT